MPLVHSLIVVDDKLFAPIEFKEEDVPLYINFVVPLNEQGKLHDSYDCEFANGDKKLLKTYNNLLLCMDIEDEDVWFRVSGQELTYAGKIKHPDFSSKFVEIRPVIHDQLDDLFDKHGICVIGCNIMNYER